MDRRIYINDFCEDLNYQRIILYIGKVNPTNLRMALERDRVNKIYRLDYALNDRDMCRRNYIYVENCDLQNLDYLIHEYISGEVDGYYDVYVLEEDEAEGKFYVNRRLWR